MIDNIYLYGWCLCVYMFMYVGAHVYVVPRHVMHMSVEFRR